MISAYIIWIILKLFVSKDDVLAFIGNSIEKAYILIFVEYSDRGTVHNTLYGTMYFLLHL